MTSQPNQTENEAILMAPECLCAAGGGKCCKGFEGIVGDLCQPGECEFVHQKCGICIAVHEMHAMLPQ